MTTRSELKSSGSILTCNDDNEPKTEPSFAQVNADKNSRVASPRIADRLLRLHQIIGPNGFIPISRSTFYSYIKAGTLNPPQRLGPRISVWKESDILAFIDGLAKSNSTTSGNGGQS